MNVKKEIKKEISSQSITADNIGPYLCKHIKYNFFPKSEIFHEGTEHVLFTGVADSQKALIIAMIAQEYKHPLVIVAPTNKDLYTWEENLRFFMPSIPMYNFSVVEKSDISVAFTGTERLRERMRALSALLNQETCVILASAVEAVQKLPSANQIIEHSKYVSVAQIIDREGFISDLVSMGYERVDQVQRTGHFSVRGDIMDVFPINEEYPLRIEFFDDEVDGIRFFDTDTQRSIKELKETRVLPISYAEENACLSDYINEGILILDELHHGEKQVKSYLKEEKINCTHTWNWKEFVKKHAISKQIVFTLIHRSIPEISFNQEINWQGQTMTNYQCQIPLFISELKRLLLNEWNIVIVSPTDSEYQQIQGYLSEANILFSEELEIGKVFLSHGTISNGFELSSCKLAVIAAKDILGRQKTKRYNKKKQGQQIRYFSDLNVGDYVVQSVHGIGRYVGMRTIEIDGIHRDYVAIQYAGSDKLYLPMNQIYTLEKYIGPEGTTPVLHKMGGVQWEKVKTKASKSIRDMAERLLAIYAKRELAKGIAFDTDNFMQREFEDGFPYVETPDQLIAIEKIKEVMEKPQPMDMLLCGDVGFGKTEVAMRAVFKCVMSGYQSMVLVPTTVLSQQHYKNFVQRMEPFGIRIAVMNRFVSIKNRNDILRKMASGELDVLIGTHAILNKKLQCHKLGLLVVDEEQRFGVAQKEKWKSWSEGIDILTLSATPIPRTLHMSLTGVRDMVTITQAPSNRHAIQTYVTEYDDNLVRNAIMREKERSGQVYFVYNRIDTIEAMAHHLKQILPEDISIVIAHGRMDGKQLENIMMDFYAGKFDVLLCTTLVENGLDQPNANTMLVYDADRMGLSQIYQMRGRVGRSEKIARAYFFYRKGKILNEVAEKRLETIREFTELGSGFKIAMRDLEIRGAGNLLGAAQHGNIANIGFMTYCNMLHDAIHELKAERDNIPIPKKLPNTILEFRQDAYIDSAYIQNEEQKLEVYHRLAIATTEEELSELLDEIIDRFGNPTTAVIKLFSSAKVRIQARNLGIGSIIDEGESYLITWADIDFIKGWNPLHLPVHYLETIHILPGSPSRVRIDKVKMKTDFLTWMQGLFYQINKQRTH